MYECASVAHEGVRVCVCVWLIELDGYCDLTFYYCHVCTTIPDATPSNNYIHYVLAECQPLNSWVQLVPKGTQLDSQHIQYHLYGVPRCTHKYQAIKGIVHALSSKIL